MIAKMAKYDFVLYAAQSGDFIERLRELGLVDITTTGWEPSENDRQLIQAIEGHAKAADFLRAFRQGEGYDPKAAPFATGEEAYEHYAAASQQAAALRSEIARLQKTADELRPWGDFSVERLHGLAAQGIVIRFFSAIRSNYDKQVAAWSERYNLTPINLSEGTAYFVVVAEPGQEVAIDAQELKAPTMDYREAEAQIAAAEQQLRGLDAEFSRVAATEELLADHGALLREQLQGVQVRATAQPAADGTLVVMEGWAEKETSDRVDALLEQYPNVIYLKSDPTPEDDTPVKLKNNRFARVFEFVGDMYARPKYGTMDLTPFFAPFYMLFFGICLNDAGYGLVLLLAGRLMRLPHRQLGVFVMMAAMGNTIFIGLAMCIELFGDIATPYVMLFYLVSSCFTQLIGIPLVRWSGEAGGFSMQMVWKFLRAPTVVSVFLSLLLVGLDIHLPSLVMSYAKYINNTVTPLALLLTGCIIHEIGLRSLRLTPTLGVMMVFRFVISPALGAALCALLGIGGLVRSVYVVELAMPVVTQTVVAAAEYGADEQLAAQGAAISTLACFVVTPVLMLLL